MPKRVYSWGKVIAGDIISFRYKGKQKGAVGTLTTVLVLNPKMPYTRKDGTKTSHLIGLKLEEKGTQPTIRNKPLLTELLQKLGEIQIIDSKSGIYRVEIEGYTGTGKRGVNKATYKRMKQAVNKHAVYRTYDYTEAKKSGVFLEPIEISKAIKESLRKESVSKIVDVNKLLASAKKSMKNVIE